MLVEIKEADGSVNSYSVPFSSVPLLQRQGRIKYAVTLAKYRTNSNEQQESKFARATLQWGGPWGTTWYGGGQYAEYYRAAMFGLGFNLGDFGQFRSMRPGRRVRWQTKANIKVSHIVFCMPKRSTNWALIFN